MINAVAYCRVSTDQEDQLKSLKIQKELFEAYAQKNGLNLIHIYSDEGISGTKTKNRTEFNQMMKDAETGIFQIVLIKDVSRLSRNTVDLLESCRKLRSYNIEVQFLNYQMNNMGNSEFVLTMFAAAAQAESEATSIRIKASKKHNAEKGKIPNFVFGYDKIIGDYFHLNINEDEAKIVKMIFKKYTEDGDGTLKIAQTLNAMGITTKRGYSWTQTAVARILNNSLYIGKIVNGKYEIVNFPESTRAKKEEKDFIIVQNEALRMIDDNTFEKAQRLLKERSNAFQTNKTRHSNQFLFSTLIKCAECGWSFRRTERTYQNTYVRWVCSARNGHGTDSCENSVSVDENILINELQKYFSSMLSDKEKYIREAKKIFLEQYGQNNEAEEKKDELTRKITELKKRKEKMILLFSKDLISIDELEEKLKTINIEIPRLELELKKYAIVHDQKAFEKSLDTVFHNIENITDIRKLSNAQLKEIIHEIKVDKDGHIDIYLNAIT